MPGASRSRQTPEKDVLSRTPGRDQYCLPYTSRLMPPSFARCPPYDVIFLFGTHIYCQMNILSVQLNVFFPRIFTQLDYIFCAKVWINSYRTTWRLLQVKKEEFVTMLWHLLFRMNGVQDVGRR